MWTLPLIPRHRVHPQGLRAGTRAQLHPVTPRQWLTWELSPWLLWGPCASSHLSPHQEGHMRPGVLAEAAAVPSWPSTPVWPEGPSHPRGLTFPN